MGGKRDAAYYRDRLEREHPTIFKGLVSGSFRSVRAAAVAAGLVREPTPLDTLKNAWKKADQAERREFAGWARVRGKPTKASARDGADLVDANRWLTDRVSSEINGVMARRNIKMGQVMTELGLKPLDASIGHAIGGGVKLNPGTLGKLARWLDKNAT